MTKFLGKEELLTTEIFQSPTNSFGVIVQAVKNSAPFLQQKFLFLNIFFCHFAIFCVTYYNSVQFRNKSCNPDAFSCPFPYPCPCMCNEHEKGRENRLGRHVGYALMLLSCSWCYKHYSVVHTVRGFFLTSAKQPVSQIMPKNKSATTQLIQNGTSSFFLCQNV